MNIFKKFLQFFLPKKEEVKLVGMELKQEETQPSKAGEIIYLLSLPQNVVHPADLLEPLCMAIAMHTQKPAMASVKDIRLYSMYSLEDEAFYGSFYALEHEGLYYGNIVGNPRIFACGTKGFRLVETDELYVPLKNDGKNIFVLMCCYKRAKAKLTAKSLKKFDMLIRNSEIVQQFAEGTSFDEAYALCLKLIEA